MKKRSFRLFGLVLLAFIAVGALLVFFNKHVIRFLYQFETTHTLLTYSDFWNKRIHDWLGDAIMLIGVMLAFTLPFAAQVVQWIVTTYGVSSFPEIANNRLNIHRLLKKMFIFVAVVIFWRLFIFKISPYTSSLFIFFNFLIAVYLLWLLKRLFEVIYYIFRCSFEFRSFIVDPSYEYIKKIAESIPTPYSEIEDISIIPDLNAKYLQNMNLLRDYEIAEFKRGYIQYKEKEGFEDYIWQYISASFCVDDVEKIKQAIELQGQLSASIRMMCFVFFMGNYSRYVWLAQGMAYYAIKHRFHFFDERLKENLKAPSRDELYSKEQERRHYYSDLLYLAEEIESEHSFEYYPILSCAYLLNHTVAYWDLLFKKPYEEIDWATLFKQVNEWENDIIWITRRLITISEKNNIVSPLLEVYHNLRNDTQFIGQEIGLQYADVATSLSPELRKTVVGKVGKFREITNEEEVTACLDFLLSNEFDDYFNITNENKKGLLINLLRMRYKFKADDLILFWLGKTSFDTSIVIKILEKASPMDASKIKDMGKHIIPTTIEKSLKDYLTLQNTQFRGFYLWGDLESYQIAFSTIVLYFLAKEIRKINDINERVNHIVTNIYKSNIFSVRDIKSISEVASLWKASPKGIETNQGIKNLCINYGIDFDELKQFYTEFLTCLKDKAKETVELKIKQAPIDKDAINDFLECFKKGSKLLLKDISVFDNTEALKEQKSRSFLSLKREEFIKEDTGIFYDNSSLVDSYLNQLKAWLQTNKDKTMTVFGGEERPTIKFDYKEEEGKIIFFALYNFEFEKND